VATKAKSGETNHYRLTRSWESEMGTMGTDKDQPQVDSQIVDEKFEAKL
jgi:hypothetical protein